MGNWFDLIFITSLCLSAYGFLIQKIQPPKTLYPFLVLVPVFLYGAFLITTTVNFQLSDLVRLILKPIRILVTLYGGYVLVRNYRKRNLNEEVIINYIFYSITLHAGIMTLQLMFPEFKDFVYEYTSTGLFRSSYDYDFRMGGLSGGSGGSVLSSVQSIGVLLSPFVIRGKKGISKILCILCIGLIINSILISGRTGIWILMIFLPIALSWNSTTQTFKLRRIIIGVVLIITFGVLIVLVFDYIEPESPLYYAFRRSLDTFLAFRREGVFEESTFNILISYIQLPNEISTWLFGDGVHLTNLQFNRALNSDIGYIRDLWGYGVFGLIAILFPIIYILFKTISSNKYLVVILTCLMLIMHAKEQFLYVRMFFSIYALILFSTYYLRNNEKQRV